jgi:hypothetical protein
MGMNVSKWQASRPNRHYTPVMWFFWRAVEVALLDTREVLADGTPSDAALLARDWIATSELEPEFGVESKFVSFPRCCDALGVDCESNRWGLLNFIDAQAESLGTDFDTDESWERLERLKAETLVDDDEPMFALPEWARVVPTIDQGAFWQSAGKAEKKHKRTAVHVRVNVVTMPEVVQLGLCMG